jgi:hypothetical protein
MRKETGMNTAGTAVLWASAFLLAGLVIVQAGRLPSNPAYAEMAVADGGYTLLTTDSGRGEDAAPNELLYVLDSREETVLVYEIEDARQKQIFLRDGGSLRNLFITGRR